MDPRLTPYAASKVLTVTDERIGTVDPESVKPLDVDGVNAMIVGTALFAIAFVVLLIVHKSLEADNSGWWIWVCATGTVFGLIGTAYTVRRRAVYRAAGRQTF